jgi:hypothetical protein
MPSSPTGPTDQLETSEAGLVDTGNLSDTVLKGLYQEPLWTVSGLRNRLRVVCSFLVVLTMLIATLQFLLARNGMNDPDIWWHLRNAEFLFQHHQLPRVDMYSWTVAGQPWINHEWLSEIPFYLGWRAGGLVGVKTVSIVLIQLVFLGLLLLCYRETKNFKASVLACALSTFLATVSFGPRTILFGYGYLVILLLILQRFRQRGTAPLWLFPPLFCLWINTHGSWSLGLIVFGTIAAAGLAPRFTFGRLESEPWSKSQFRKLLLTGIASVAALFVNPFGYRLVLYPFDLAFRQKLNITHVAEWVSVDFHNMRGKIVLLFLITLILGTLLRNRHWSLAELALLLFSLYSGLTYTRFLFLLALLAAPTIAKILDFAPPYRAAADTPFINACVIALMVGAMLHYWPTAAMLQKSVDEVYPTQALGYLNTHQLDGPVLTHYLWGGYLEWNARNQKVFIDSRVDIFEYAGILKDYIDVLGLKESQRVLDKYKIRYVLFSVDEPLVFGMLEHNPGWKTLYRDKLTVLFERTDQTSRTAAN